ncbi:MAG TPA: hypothetical protein VF868_07425 [Bacteroidia bacterium]|jgi:hypothetical protein
MSDVKFNMDQPDLPDDQINKHKNFKKLMYNYQYATKPLYKTPLYKNKKVFLIILLVLLVMFIITEIIEKEEVPPAPANKEQTK